MLLQQQKYRTCQLHKWQRMRSNYCNVQSKIQKRLKCIRDCFAVWTFYWKRWEDVKFLVEESCEILKRDFTHTQKKINWKLTSGPEVPAKYLIDESGPLGLPVHSVTSIDGDENQLIDPKTQVIVSQAVILNVCGWKLCFSQILLTWEDCVPTDTLYPFPHQRVRI